MAAAVAAVLVLMGPAAMPAAAQQPLAQTTVEALVQALGDGPATRSFRRTTPPEAGSHLCAEAGGSKRAGAPATAGNKQAHRAATRNLEVVPYAGDTTPGVNLSVQFAHASDALTAADRKLLDTLAAALQRPELQGERFAVAGHTDSSGEARINLELSCARALSVRRYLLSQGVGAQRLSAYGFGHARLLAASDERDPAQRRVEIRKAAQP